MTPPLWVTELAADFWADVGEHEPFPRSLRLPILRSSLDLTIEELAGLTTSGVERYLALRGCARRCGEADRPLRACLVAESGGGYVFLDARDEPAERTLSLAHELAHFLRHYWQPRRRAVLALGEGALDILDGRRPATAAERLTAVLRNVPVGCHVHLMRRSVTFAIPEVDMAEQEADQLAFELLAPAVEVLARVPEYPSADGVAALLRGSFGLPEAAAADYAAVLAPAPERSPLLARLKKTRPGCRTSASAREHSAGGLRDEPSA
jgi:hypothetical protein